MVENDIRPFALGSSNTCANARQTLGIRISAFALNPQPFACVRVISHLNGRQWLLICISREGERPNASTLDYRRAFAKSSSEMRIGLTTH